MKRPGLAAAVVLGLGALPGCVWGGIGSGVYAATGGGGSSGGGPPPSLQIASSVTRTALVDKDGAPSAAEIRIDYRAIDTSYRAIGLDVTWKLASEPDTSFRPASEADGSDGTADLEASPDPGILHSFVWDAGADLDAAGEVEAEVVVRFVPVRPEGVGVRREVTFIAGNRPPTIVAEPAAGIQGRTVLTHFQVADSQDTDITVRLVAQDLAGGPGYLAQNQLLVQGSETIVAATIAGARSGIVWDSVDVDGTAPSAAFGLTNLDAKLTLIAFDRFGATAVTTTTIRIENQ